MIGEAAITEKFVITRATGIIVETGLIVLTHTRGIS